MSFLDALNEYFSPYRMWRSTQWHLRLFSACYGVDEAGWPLRDDPEAA